MLIQNSNRKGKRFVAIFKDGTKIHFGQDGGSTYIDHGDKNKRDAYLARHSRGRSLDGNIAAFKRRFSV